MAKVLFKNVSFSYGNKQILDNFNLEIEDSEIMGIVGPSGCGKTTAIRCLCGFINPEQGEIFIGDRCVFSKEKRINVPPEERNIGVVFQDYAVWPHMTVAENVAYPLQKQGVEEKKRQEIVMDALKMVDMDRYHEHLPSQLSGGQQQRVAIARALVSSEELIVLDEPITNLDLKLREQMLIEIRNIQETVGTTIVYITHDQGAALQLCDNIAVMDQKGYINQIGSDLDLIFKPENRYVYTFMGLSNFLPCEIKDGKTHLIATDGQKVLFEENSDEEDGFYDFAFRPTDLEFEKESPLKARILSVTFLGNITNYFIDFLGHEIRVQRPALSVRTHGAYSEGDEIGVRLNRYNYFERETGERNV